MMNNTFKLATVLCFLLIARSSSAQSDRTTLSAFYQGRADNCASIAAIKAAINKFGMNKVFTAQKTKDGFSIKLRDGTLLSLSDIEVLEAGQYSKFITNEDIPVSTSKPVVEYATLCYAVMAKYISNQGLWLCEEQGSNPNPAWKFTYLEALQHLSSPGICTDNSYRHLGLKSQHEKVQDYPANSEVLKSKKGVLVYTQGHAVCMANGMIDCYGDWAEMKSSTKCNGGRFKPRWYIELAD